MADENELMEFARAAENGDVGELKKLLGNGVDVNEKPTKGMSALMLAAEKNHLDAVKFLLRKGADPKAKDLDSMTTLHIAALNGN